MSTPEEQELLAQINRLEGRINRHKAGNHLPENQPYSARGTYRAVPYSPRGGYRGRGRGGTAPMYRNKTLVLNGQSRPCVPGESGANTSSESSWVTKTDRHLQLINTAVFEKDSQTRASAIEQTQRQRRQKKEQAEKSRVLNFVQQNGRNIPASSNVPTATTTKYEIAVDGIRFQVTKQGSKLVRAPDDRSSPSATPKIASIGGVKFYRTKNGNLVRHGIAKAQRMAGGIKKIDSPCKIFSWTGIVSSINITGSLACNTCRLRRGKKSPGSHTNFYLGSCPKGPRCRYLHDPSKVAVCRDWLFKSDCPNGEACDLAHETTEERTPLCMHFANGKCNNESCPYIHAEHSQTDPVCRSFGFYGFCEKGARCPDRHVFECPDFSNTGVCKTEGCKLLHRERASVLRKASNRDSAREEEELGDVSSDDDDDVAGASDDLDSDEVDEFIGKDEVDDLDFSKDFIGFS